MADLQAGNQPPQKGDNQPLAAANVSDKARILIIGAGARGNAYARAISTSAEGVVAAVAEPIRHKREALGKKYIWGLNPDRNPNLEHFSFEDWRAWIQYEQERRRQEEMGLTVHPGIDAVFVCTLDETHAEILVALSSLNLHLMSEKPLATSLNDCLKIYRSLQPVHGEASQKIFSCGHVLRYSPHNLLLRKLLLEEGAIGEILSIEHTEPVGWWHFAHSYVRGNWRKESTTAPSLMTKSCHDIDLLLWLLCSPPPGSNRLDHLPSQIMSAGSLSHFKLSRKPALAGKATNCLVCPAERECIYSAKKIYLEDHLAKDCVTWPVDIVVPEIEDYLRRNGPSAASVKLIACLAEDYNMSTPQQEIEKRPWFGRCVYESDNDVCDDQVVVITWEDDPLPPQDSVILADRLASRGAKTATIHMTAFTEKRCERRGRIYGTKGEIEYDSKVIQVYDFASKKTDKHYPHQPGGGHGGGDVGLTTQFVRAVHAVKNGEQGVEEAQKNYIGCTLEDVIRSHAMVFAAEDARKEKRVVDLKEWWSNVESRLGEL